MLISNKPIKCPTVSHPLEWVDRKEGGSLILTRPPHQGLLPELLQWVPHWSPSFSLHPSPSPLVSTQQREVQVQLLVYDTPQNHLIWSQSQVLSLTNSTLHNLVHVLLFSPSQSIQPHLPPSSFLNSKVCSCLKIFAFTISSTCSSCPSHIQDYLLHFLISFRCLLKCYVVSPPNIPILWYFSALFVLRTSHYQNVSYGKFFVTQTMSSSFSRL